MTLRWRTTFVGICAAVTGALLVAPATAEPGTSRPVGWHPPGHVDPRPTNEELAEALDTLAERSDGRVEVREIGMSNEAVPVWAARVGIGPVRLQYVTQQHGNEPLGTPAAVEFLRGIGLADTPRHRWLRSRVTVEVIVRANPDGHARDWRYNYDPDADPEFGEPGKGYDINRYHNPGLAPDDNPATEAAHIQRAYIAFNPDIVVDYHMQGRYVDDDGDEITASLMWPTHGGVTDADTDAAKRVVVVAERAMTDFAGANVSQYPGGNYDGIARNAYGLRGSASVLLELSNMGPRHEQRQIRAAYVSMLAVTHAAADGSLARIDPEWAEAIPPRGDPLGGGSARALRADSMD